MCNAYNLNAKLFAIASAAAEQLDLRLIFSPGVTAETSNLPVPASMFPKSEGLFLKGADGGLDPAVGRWGLVAPGERKPLKDIKFVCNNARSEAMSETYPFKFVMKNRCVIPMSSFAEWTGPKGTKTRHTITGADGGLLFAAGLWSEATPVDGPVCLGPATPRPVAIPLIVKLRLPTKRGTIQ